MPSKLSLSVLALSQSLPMAPPIRQWLRSSPLGSGSFGNVSLAINLEDGQVFAVKSTPCSAPSAELQAIESELRILQSLHSPRILSCLGGDYSSENGLPCRNLFLEYMVGGSIAELVKKSGGRLDEGRVRCYTRGIVEGLAYLHQQGIVHCDIKGQNVLVGSCGVKIADFGAAKRLESPEREGSNLKGTPLWMAPEVVLGVEQGCPSDIWSLGCTVVEMLQGRPPWESKNLTSSSTSVAAMLFKIGCSQENPPLPESVSEEGRDFLSKCLQRDPKDRWTAAQLLDHPFVQVEPETLTYSEQTSPRSILDILSESDGGDEGDDTTDSVPICSLPRPIPRPSVPSWLEGTVSIKPRGNVQVAARAVSSACDVSIPQDCVWVKVRCASGWLEERQKPFMRESLEHPMVKKKGCEVNLESVAFLLQGRMPVG